MKLEKHARELVEEYGVERNRVLLALNGATGTEPSWPWEPTTTYTFLTDTLSAGGPDVVALVEDPEGAARVLSVHVVPEGLLPKGLSSDGLAGAMKRFGQTYGLGVRVGQESVGRVVVGERIRRGANPEPFEVLDPIPPGATVVRECITDPRPDRNELDPTDNMHVLLACAINTTAVRKAVGLD